MTTVLAPAPTVSFIDDAFTNVRAALGLLSDPDHGMLLDGEQPTPGAVRADATVTTHLIAALTAGPVEDALTRLSAALTVLDTARRTATDVLAAELTTVTGHLVHAQLGLHASTATSRRTRFAQAR